MIRDSLRSSGQARPRDDCGPAERRCSCRVHSSRSTGPSPRAIRPSVRSRRTRCDSGVMLIPAPITTIVAGSPDCASDVLKSRVSTRIPASFRPSTSTSFGHFNWQATPCSDSARRTASPHARLRPERSATWAPYPPGERNAERCVRSRMPRAALASPSGGLILGRKQNRACEARGARSGARSCARLRLAYQNRVGRIDVPHGPHVPALDVVRKMRRYRPCVERSRWGSNPMRADRI